jgi:hypothetical protein
MLQGSIIDRAHSVNAHTLTKKAEVILVVKGTLALLEYNLLRGNGLLLLLACGIALRQLLGRFSVH